MNPVTNGVLPHSDPITLSSATGGNVRRSPRNYPTLSLQDWVTRF